jgi:hypothetical protein
MKDKPRRAGVESHWNKYHKKSKLVMSHDAYGNNTGLIPKNPKADKEGTGKFSRKHGY